jgi:hypothetical protein
MKKIINKIYLSLAILMMSYMDASATPLLDDELKQSAPFNSTVQVIKDAQVTNVEAALFVFTRNVTAGENFRAEVLVLRDPETGLSWWGFHGSSEVLSQIFTRAEPGLIGGQN